ncbi:MAG: D-alanine--D-alanine ligase family protein [Anaerotignum sp.]
MSIKTVVVLFGGQSSEHEVSRMSATTMLKALDSKKYQVIPVGITKEGQWLIYTGPTEHIATGGWEKYATPAIISPDAKQRALLKVVNGHVKEIPIDVVIPALHGAWGEDGTIQGLLEMACIPYVGCGVLSSAVCMDKVFTKLIAKGVNIAQAKYVWFNKAELKEIDKVVAQVEKKLGYPCFVKPSNAGSSVGISKVLNQDELVRAIELAAKFDRKIIVEEAISGREFECAVLGNEEPSVSGVGEVLSATEFYDYDAKYNNSQSRTVIPAPITEDEEKTIRKVAAKIYQAVDGSGLARVDFFIENETGRVLLNEINSMPGFTAISMYPMLWEAAGMTKEELMDCLIELALSRDSGIRG